jgi:hypothetical protein
MQLKTRRRAKQIRANSDQQARRRIVFASIFLTPKIEALEDRRLYSAVPQIMHTTFRRKPVAAGTAQPLTGSATPSGVTPAQMRKAYGQDSISFGSVTGDGSGQTIAIIDAYNEPTLASDLASFDSYYGVAAPPSLTQINETGGSTLPASDAAGGWGIETALDVEWSHVMAPNAKILVVEATTDNDSDLYAAVTEARSYSGVSVVSMSWGGDEASTDAANDDSLFTTPTGHQGVTFLASSGDNGAYSDTTAGKVIVGYPAASVNVVAVGGTTLTTDGSGNYTSETGWGNGTSSFTKGGSGGGISLYAAQPSYQTGIVTQSTTKRTLPDVSMDADPNSGVAVYSAYDNGSSTPWATYGGTSLASPMFAGVIAVADQGRVAAGKTTLDGSTQTLPMLYAMSSSDFHDITSGNNYYAAGSGYDLVTGRGSPVATLLIPALVGTTTPTPVIGGFALSPSSITAGASTAITLSATNVTETSGTISSVKFYLESNGTTGLQTAGDTLIGTGTLSGTSYNYSGYSAAALAAGTYTLYAQALDSTNSTSATASSTLTVNSASPTGTLATWNISGQSAFGTQGLISSTITTGLTNSLGLTRGSGVTTNPTAASRAWGGNGWNSSSTAGITNNEFATFGFTVSSGYTASLTSIDMNYRRSSTGPANGYWQDQVNGGAWNLIGDFTNEFSSSTSSGGAITEIPLTGLSSLTAGTTVNFRATPYGATSSSGTWYVYNVTSSTKDLVINGSVSNAVASGPLHLTGPANYLMLDNDGATVDIWNSTTNTGTPSQQVLLSQITTMSYTGSSSNDSLTVDFSNGDPLVSSGISFDGGSGGTNALNLIGTATDNIFTAGAGAITVASRFGTVPISYTNTTGISITAGAGTNQVIQTSAGTAPLTLVDPSVSDVVDVQAGTFTFAAGTSSVNAIPLDTLHIEAGATVVLASASSHSFRSVLSVNTLEDAGVLDLRDNDMILHQAGYSNIRSALGKYIISSNAIANPTGLTTLALMPNSDSSGNPIFGSSSVRGLFDGQNTIATDLLIKYTYFGDADLSGFVDATDYSRLDSGLLLQSTGQSTGQFSGWYNGDFNLDGVINGSDYTLADNAFNSQGPSLGLTSIAGSSVRPATFSSAIQAAIALVPQSAGAIASTSVINFGTTVYTGPLNVTNTLNRIRAGNGPDRSDDGSVYTNPQASGLPVDGTYYEFTVEPASGTNMNFSSISSPGPMRIVLATGGDCYFTGDHYSTFQAVYIAGSGAPVIGGFSVSPTSVTTGSSATLTATGVSESGGTISSVSFYRESNSTSGLQIGSDTLIGIGTQSGTSWSIATSTTGLAAAAYTYYAVATDSASVSSAASSTTLVVTAVGSPTIGSFTDNPTSVTAGASTTLTAGSVNESGGTISSVKFYRESNSTTGLQIGSDTLLGTGTQSGSTWTLSTSTSGLVAGTYTYYAVATDAASVSSAASSVTLTVNPVVVPTIGSFTANPTTVSVGGSTTLTAGGVTEIGGNGTVTAVQFYRESNGTSGLQIGADTLLGTGVQSGTTWTLATATTGLSAGTFTYYAVATDSNSLTSAASSASLVVSASTTTGAVLGWNMNGQTGFGTPGLAAASVAAGLTNSTGLTRGSGVTTTGTAANNGWGGQNWSTSTSSAGIAANEFVTFGLTVTTGFQFSASSIDLNYRRSSSGPTNALWQYELNNGTWTSIADVSGEFASTSTSGTSIAELSLASITGLQNLAAGTSVQFRLIPYAASTTGGTFYIYDLSGTDLTINGTVATA